MINIIRILQILICIGSIVTMYANLMIPLGEKNENFRYFTQIFHVGLLTTATLIGIIIIIAIAKKALKHGETELTDIILNEI